MKTKGLARSLFDISQLDQGKAFISDAIADATDEEALQMAKNALFFEVSHIQKLEKWIAMAEKIVARKK